MLEARGEGPVATPGFLQNSELQGACVSFCTRGPPLQVTGYSDPVDPAEVPMRPDPGVIPMVRPLAWGGIGAGLPVSWVV